MTLNKEGLDAAIRALMQESDGEEFVSDAEAEGSCRYLASIAIAAYLAALPAPDGLVERLLKLADAADGSSSGAKAALCEAATVIQTLQRDLADRDMQLEASATVALELSSRLEAAEQQVRDMLAAVNWALGATGEFRLRESGEGQFWWRAELAARAGLTFDRETCTYRLVLKNQESDRG